MTVSPSEVKPEETLNQEKIDMKSQQNEVVAKSDQNQEETKQAEKPEDPNWRAFREARKKDRADKEAAEKRAQEKAAEAEALKAALEASLSKYPIPTAQQNQYQQTSYQYGEQPEETEEQKINRKVEEAIEKREQKRRQEEAEREQREMPRRLQQQFPDYNQIVTQENLDYLEYHHPELAVSLGMNPEGITKWSLVYNAIKKYIPNAVNSKRESERVQQNLMKPKSMSSVGMTQNTEQHSARLSEEKKAANWARMQKEMKSI